MTQRRDFPYHLMPAACAGVLLFAAAGAFVGESASAGGMLVRDSSATLPQAVYTGSPQMGPAVSPPDQYAIDTPEGRTEVGELAMRGLYSQARYGMRTVGAWPEDEGLARDLASYDAAETPDPALFAADRAEPEAESETVVEVSPLPALALAQ